MEKAKVLLLCVLCLSAAFAQSPPPSSWTLLNWRDQGYVTSLASGGGVLVAANGLQLFRSLDSGKIWRPFPVPVDSQQMGMPGRPPVWISFDPTAGLFYCSNGFQIFTAAPTAPSWSPITDCCAFGSFSADGRTLIHFNDTGLSLRVSRDGGGSWKSSGYPPSDHPYNQEVMSVLAAGPCVYAGWKDTAVTVSCDGGSTWRSSGGGLLRYTNFLAHSQAAILAFSDSGVFRTQDSGKSWSSSWPSGGIGRIIRVSQSGTSVFAWTLTDSLFHSRDGGLTWESLGRQDFRPAQGGLRELTVLGGSLLGATDRGLVGSPDQGRTWSLRTSASLPASAEFLGAQAGTFIAGTRAGIFTSGDSGASWRLSLPNAGGAPWTAFGGDGMLHAAGSRDGNIHVTSDAGATWSPLRRLPSADSVVSVEVFDHTVLAGSASGLWRHSPTDGVWTKIPLPLPSAEAPRLLAAGEGAILVGGITRAWELSRDGTLSERTAGIAPALFNHLHVIGERQYAIDHYGYLHRWDAEAAAWARVTGVPNQVSAIAGAADRLVIINSSGTVYSEDGGRTVSHQWLLDTDYMSKPIRTIITLDGRFYAGDDIGGVWRLEWALPETATGIRTPARRRTQDVRTGAARGIFPGGWWRADGRITK